MPTFNNSTFFPVLLPVHPRPLKGFQDLMPHKSQFVYETVLTFIFLHSLLLLWMCRSQGTHATKHLVNMPGRCAFQNHFPPFSQLGNLTHLTKPGSNVTSCSALPVPGSGPPLLCCHHLFSVPRSHAFSMWAILSPTGKSQNKIIIILMYKHRYTYNTQSGIQYIEFNCVCVSAGVDQEKDILKNA